MSPRKEQGHELGQLATWGIRAAGPRQSESTRPGQDRVLGGTIIANRELLRQLFESAGKQSGP